ncbi:hypothetical protein CC86DRAFT_380716 [Ophiobolus disseminans]|uniref:Uncharacterized protein n=1 Tax=Ophiobolus disseminans TaxID=1469910 RepID=A0A6A7A8D6_9PLEO|nr:hypothetical protein CC86DRAFT_380716 [Ophiobolus disseminans]
MSVASIYNQDDKWYLGAGTRGEFRMQFKPDAPNTVKATAIQGIHMTPFFGQRVPYTIINWSRAMAAAIPGDLDPINELFAAEDTVPFEVNDAIATAEAALQDALKVLNANEMWINEVAVWKGATETETILEVIDTVGEVVVEALVIPPLALMAKTLFPKMRALLKRAHKSANLANLHTMLFSSVPDFTISVIGDDVALGKHENMSVGYQGLGQYPFIGVKIVVPTQVLHKGYAPYYEVCHNTKRDFSRPSSTPADAVTTEEGKYIMVLTPVAGGITFSVSVSIRKKKTVAQPEKPE